MILKACADIINKLYLGNVNVFTRLEKALKDALIGKVDINEELNKLLEKKNQLNSDIDFLLKERTKAPTVDMKITLDNRYQDLVNDYQNVVAEIQILQDKAILKQ